MRPRQQPGTLGNISITQATNGSWRANAWLYDHQGQRQRLRATAATPDEAIDALRKRATERLKGIPSAITADMTMDQATRVWFGLLDGRSDTLSERTISHYKYWGEIIINTCANLALADLTVGTCEAIIERIRIEHGAATARSGKKALSLILGTATRHGALPSNPVRDTARLEGPAKIESALTAAGFHYLLEMVTEWRRNQRGGTQPDRDLLYDAILLTTATSCRPSELLAFRRCDLTDTRDPQTGTRVAKLYLCGKIVNVPQQGAVREPHPKRRSQSRIITLPEFAYSAIDRRLTLTHHDPEALLFATATGRPRSVSNLERLLRSFRTDHRQEIELDLGIPFDEFTWKLFRRTAATLIGEAAGISLASSLLGHAQEATTERHYRVRRAEVNPQTAAILDEQLKSTPTPPPPPAPPSEPSNVIQFPSKKRV